MGAIARIMHEMSIMESALAMVLHRAREAGAAQVHVVRLRIGALSGVVTEALEFAFQAMVPGTLAAEAQLVVEHVPARFWCAECQNEFQAGELFAECPVCHTPSVDLRAGREMQVASMEIE